MTTDTLFREEDIGVRPFVFNEQVAAVFPDMIRRSVPGYATTLDAIGRLAARHLQAGTHGYDLGCSLGAATLAMRHGARRDAIRLIGIDNSEAMLTRCREIIAADTHPIPVELRLADVTESSIDEASMVVLNYTLQFVPREQRTRLLRRIAKGMVPNGILVLSEKIRIDNDEVNRAITDLHEDFKRRNAYSELEISRKRQSLENVLVPDSLADIEARLKNAGFKGYGVWLQYYNFVSLLAFK